MIVLTWPRSSGSATRRPRSTTATGWPAGPVLVANGRWVPPRLPVPPDSQAPGSAFATASPPVPWSGPSRGVGLEPNGVDDWFEEVAGHGSEARRSAASGSTGPGISSPATPSTDSRLRSRGQGRPEQPASRDAPPSSARPTGCSSTRRRGLIPYTVFDTTNGPITIGAGCLGPAVHAGRGAVLDRP